MSTNADLRTKFHEAVSQGSKAPWVDTPPAFRGSRLPPDVGRMKVPSTNLGGLQQPSFLAGGMVPPILPQNSQPQQQYLHPSALSNYVPNADVVPTATTEPEVSSSKSKIYMYLLGLVIILILIGLAYWGYRKWCDSKKAPVVMQGGDWGDGTQQYRGDPRLGGGILKQPPRFSGHMPAAGGAENPRMVRDFRDVTGGMGPTGYPPGATHQPPNQQEEQDPNFTPLSQATIEQ